ncbi:RraA family protein [Parendozoicomonas haliclonae]|uniref:Putative 4-hydroxy-4-methyl-2-oxoglutarate aldolase n=1 Tax=Parendozoicomonas haliclonae TaxID=1960125 RepID=A0A1X7ATS8_9GAMM|nr:RraA family protein [Parendozoicomonas haliclonae]SMA50817.1 putative regulator of ribonuclease activity [Parendozoicomonas haliclonae]
MSMSWTNDDELFAMAREQLFVAVVGDVLDKMGYTHQFLSPYLKPVQQEAVILGRAMPVLEADVFDAEVQGNNPLMNKPFGLMFEALDDLKKNEVYICSGSSHRYALWGGLMSTRAIMCGAAGAVVHGFHRDTTEIERLNFPIASFGSYAQDQGVRGKVIDWRVPIEVDGVRVRDGDIIFGDRDGVLVIPHEVADEAFQAAFEKAATENLVLKALQDGMSTVDAFAKFGVM